MSSSEASSYQALSQAVEQLVLAHARLKRDYAELQERHRLAVSQAHQAAERLQVLKLSLGQMSHPLAVEQAS
ncbi:MAG: hypothetical protein RLZZ502_1803 [Pseudomonadota bacterium]|jgi:phage shock protein A